MRQDILDTTAKRAGGVWALARRQELAAEGRLVEGGWPGTIGEARVRAAGAIRGILVEKSMVALTYEELGRAARLTYDEARRAWLSMLAPRAAHDPADEA